MGRLVFLGLLWCGYVFAQPAAAQLPDWVKVEANISYGSHPENVLDILQPSRGSLAARPAAIVIHGGGWVGGNKDGMVAGHALRYLEEGFVVCNVEYRLGPKYPAPAAVEDVLQATQWLRDNAKRFNVDTRRLVVTGTSAGGHLSLMVGMTPKSANLGPEGKVAAVVNWYGITDVADQLSGPNRRDYAVTWLPEQTGRLDLAARLSPLTYVRKGVPPILTIHGDADQTVPYEHGVEITRKLRDAGAVAELIPVPGGGHGRFPPETMDSIYKHIFQFLKKHKVAP